VYYPVILSPFCLSSTRHIIPNLKLCMRAVRAMRRRRWGRGASGAAGETQGGAWAALQARLGAVLEGEEASGAVDIHEHQGWGGRNAPSLLPLLRSFPWLSSATRGGNRTGGRDNGSDLQHRHTVASIAPFVDDFLVRIRRSVDPLRGFNRAASCCLKPWGLPCSSSVISAYCYFTSTSRLDHSENFHCL
jgi:hypothetical protein